MSSISERIEAELKKLDLKPEKLELFDPATIHLFTDEKTGFVRASIANNLTILQLKAKLAFPVTLPDKYVQLYGTRADGSPGELFGLIKTMDKMSRKDRKLLEDVIRKTHMVPVIIGVRNVERKLRTYVLKVDTDRGPMELCIARPRESIQRRDRGKYLLVDLDNGRYEIEDLYAFDKKSREMMDEII